MANTANLRGYLSDLANAIRHVSGLNNNIPANQYDLIINNFILSNETSLNITPSTIAQNFGAPAGYSGYNSINVAPVTSNIDPNIVPAYILNGVNILGVVGNYDVPLSNIDIAPSTNIQNIIAPAGTGYNVINIGAVTANIDNNITPENIVNGVNILGIIGNYQGQVINNQNKTVTPTTSQQMISADEGYTGLGDVTVNAVTASIDENITATNIKKGVTILGVEGLLEFQDETPLFASVEEMEAAVDDYPEKTLCIVYSDDYLGTYEKRSGEWVLLSVETDGYKIMNILNLVDLIPDDYDGYGGTEQEIMAVLNQIA